MYKKTLLLNASYEILSFISERKAVKLLLKNKADILSIWDEKIKYGEGDFVFPATLKLKHFVRRPPHYIHFSRQAIVKRDKQTCQYCLKKLIPSEVTIDHIMPRCKGGGSSFANCVVSCLPCNNKKGDKLLEESGLKLLIKPTHPSFDGTVYLNYSYNYWHQDWDLFIERYTS